MDVEGGALCTNRSTELRLKLQPINFVDFAKWPPRDKLIGGDLAGALVPMHE